jgi:hypothetical protein
MEQSLFFSGAPLLQILQEQCAEKGFPSSLHYAVTRGGVPVIIVCGFRCSPPQRYFEADVSAAPTP